MNPFDVENDGKLYNISSGAPVTYNIAEDILSAEKGENKLWMNSLKTG